MNINDLDLNLLRAFDAVYRLRNVGRAAQVLGLSQPATSQALTRLRVALGDPLFARAPGGVRPTPKADRLAQAVQSAIALLEDAFNETQTFDPRQSRMTLRLHLSDIGEARFLPALMGALHRQAPGVQVQSFVLPHADIAAALDSGRIDFAIGFLPSVHETRSARLLDDRYILMVREDHPLVPARSRQGRARPDLLRQLEYVAVRTHSETFRVLQLLRLEDRIRLTASHFLALPAIVRTTDLAVVMPQEIADGFVAAGGFHQLRPQLKGGDFSVSLHWSVRFESDPAHRWMRSVLLGLFQS